MAAQQPTSLQNHTQQELFPLPLPALDMQMYFSSWQVPNIFEDMIPQTVTYDASKIYTRASTTVCNAASGALPDDWVSTKNRTLLYHFATFGSMRIFTPTNPNDYDRIVSRHILQAWQTTSAAPNTSVTPTVPHWAKLVPRPNANQARVPTWFRHAFFRITKERDDVKKLWLKVAKDTVWPFILDGTNPQFPWNNRSFWQSHAVVPGRVVGMMLYFIRQHQNLRPRIVKFLIGTNSNYIDIDALYAAQTYGPWINVAGPNIQGNLVYMLIDQIEYACAHILNQVLENYFLMTPTPASTRIVAPNLKHLAASSAWTLLLEANVAEFPVM